VPSDDATGYYRALSAPDQATFSEEVRRRFRDELSWMQYADSVTYFPDDILTKVDRVSMAVSLEARVPLLDHRVAAFAWQVQTHFKMRGGQGKWLLRQVLYKYVPRTLVERPKTGFGVPIDAWLRGPLKDWAADLLDPTPIQEKWAEHQSGRRNWKHFLWNVLTFEAWRRAKTAA
jgi:asparagine synthase (glutamine-hydrolysing)